MMSIEQENRHLVELMGKNSRTLRLKKGWSIVELSVRSGIVPSILEQVEIGGDFELGYFFQLCDFYGEQPKALFEKVL